MGEEVEKLMKRMTAVMLREHQAVRDSIERKEKTHKVEEPQIDSSSSSSDGHGGSRSSEDDISSENDPMLADTKHSDPDRSHTPVASQPEIDAKPHISPFSSQPSPDAASSSAFSPPSSLQHPPSAALPPDAQPPIKTEDADISMDEASPDEPNEPNEPSSEQPQQDAEAAVSSSGMTPSPPLSPPPQAQLDSPTVKLEAPQSPQLTSSHVVQRTWMDLTPSPPPPSSFAHTSTSSSNLNSSSSSASVAERTAEEKFQTTSEVTIKEEEPQEQVPVNADDMEYEQNTSVITRFSSAQQPLKAEPRLEASPNTANSPPETSFDGHQGAVLSANSPLRADWSPSPAAESAPQSVAIDLTSEPADEIADEGEASSLKAEPNLNCQLKENGCAEETKCASRQSAKRKASSTPSPSPPPTGAAAAVESAKLEPGALPETRPRKRRFIREESSSSSSSSGSSNDSSSSGSSSESGSDSDNDSDANMTDADEDDECVLLRAAPTSSRPLPPSSTLPNLPPLPLAHSRRGSVKLCVSDSVATATGAGLKSRSVIELDENEEDDEGEATLELEPMANSSNRGRKSSHADNHERKAGKEERKRKTPAQVYDEEESDTSDSEAEHAKPAHSPRRPPSKKKKPTPKHKQADSGLSKEKILRFKAGSDASLQRKREMQQRHQQSLASMAAPQMDASFASSAPANVSGVSYFHAPMDQSVADMFKIALNQVKETHKLKPRGQHERGQVRC